MCPKDPACVVGVASVSHWDDLGTLGQPWDVGPWDDIVGGPGPWDDIVGGPGPWDDLDLGTTWTLGRPGGTLGRRGGTLGRPVPWDDLVGRHEPWDDLDLGTTWWDLGTT